MIELYAREFGEPGSPPMVVLHGMLGSSRNWMSAAAALTPTWRVSALDLRNHGKSPHTETMDYDAMVDDVLHWMDGQGLQQVDLMGHSMGGKVAMTLACRHPERVSRLIVVDIAPKSYFSNGHRTEFVAMHELSLKEIKSRGDAELKLEGRVSDWGMRKFITTNLERTAEGGWRWLINLPVISTSIPKLEQAPLNPDERFDGPVLFVLGGKSRYVKPEDHPAILAHFPQAEIVTIAESGHNPHMETRAAFVAEVLHHRERHP